MVILKIKITLILLNPTGIRQSSKIGGLERLNSRVKGEQWFMTIEGWLLCFEIAIAFLWLIGHSK